MKKNLLAVWSFLLVSGGAMAQLSYGGQPQNWDDKHYPSTIPTVTTPIPDRTVLAAEDAVVDQYKEAPYRFGVEFEMDLNTSNSGNWTFDERTGMDVWQLAIACPDAQSVSFVFDQFRLPKGGQVFVWNDDRTMFLGSFTHKNNNANNALAIGVMHDSNIVIEYQVPASLTDRGDLHINQVTYGYREISVGHFEDVNVDRGPFGNSGSCNINVNCPDGDAWQVEKKSVALIVSGGSAICTGALVNNTAMDGTPYFLTANHCLGGSVANWVFYFNHESAGCTGSNGPTNQSISGATLRASNGGSDFALLELNSTPPASFNVQYSGWDRTDLEANVSEATCIHHPAGDVKKISHELDAPYHDTQFGAEVWYIDNWESGVTEGGSSGSPLFNQDHRIIGQLYGGYSSCSAPNDADWYGRFGVSWDGTSASSRLRDWLDPVGSNPTVLDGYPEGFVAAALDGGVASINNIPSTVCGAIATGTVTIRNAGVEPLNSCTISWSLNGSAAQTFNWVGTLNQGETEDVPLPWFNLANGSNTLTVEMLNPNNATDENLDNNSQSYTFTAFTGSDVMQGTLVLLFDNYADETSWELQQNGVVVYSSNGLYDASLDATTLEIPMCLPAGCYDLVVMDDYGDGMCCAYGEGSYTFYNQNMVAIATGGEFADSETVTVCLDPLSVPTVSADSFGMFPNPANDLVNFNGLERDSQITIFDATGRVVMKSQIQSFQYQMNVSALTNGVYFVRYETKGNVSVKELVIRK